MEKGRGCKLLLYFLAFLQYKNPLCLPSKIQRLYGVCGQFKRSRMSNFQLGVDTWALCSLSLEAKIGL